VAWTGSWDDRKCALDSVVNVPTGADRDRLLAALDGHVIAKRELMVTYRQQISPPK